MMRVWTPCVSVGRLFSQKRSPGSKYVKPLFGIRRFFVEKSISFIRGYEKILETKFPQAFRIYRVFAVGTKDLYTDIKEYIRISASLRNGKSVRDLQRKELEKYFSTPKDLMKVGPVLLLAALPFANYVILPVIYMFPRQCLTSHFWSLQQRVDFALKAHRKKLYNYRPVFRHLQAKVSSVENEVLKNKCFNILYKVGSGVHPSVKEILEVKPLFSDQPYGLNFLSASHLRGLCRMHGLSALPIKRSRLWTHAGFVREMDLAVEREGLYFMSTEDLRWACFLRGLNPIGLQKEEMIAWLTQWVSIACNVDSRSLSLLLHCPILLSYNYSSNWVLIH